MNTLRPAEDGTLVPASARVFRIGKKAHLSLAALRRGKASPAMFELSSEDKAALGQRLSIWVEELTIADQAWTFMGANPERTIVACLNVAAIHAIPAEPGFDSLRVEWEQALIDGGNGYKVPNTKPGAEGHAGIAGLNQGGNGITHRNQRKSLREALAEITTISPVPVPTTSPRSIFQ